MLELSGFDLKRAQLVPHAVFESPDEVVRASFLSFAQKQAILRRWEFDVRRMGAQSDALASIQTALKRLAAERSAPARAAAGESEATPAPLFEAPGSRTRPTTR